MLFKSVWRCAVRVSATNTRRSRHSTWPCPRTVPSGWVCGVLLKRKTNKGTSLWTSFRSAQMQTVTIRKQDLVLGNVCGIVKSLFIGNGTVNNFDLFAHTVQGCWYVLSPTRKETSYSDRRFSFSYILFIIIIGGILVLFIYITRLASNEIFSPSNKIHQEVGRG